MRRPCNHPFPKPALFNGGVQAFEQEINSRGGAIWAYLTHISITRVENLKKKFSQNSNNLHLPFLLPLTLTLTLPSPLPPPLLMHYMSRHKMDPRRNSEENFPSFKSFWNNNLLNIDENVPSPSSVDDVSLGGG